MKNNRLLKTMACAMVVFSTVFTGVGTVSAGETIYVTVDGERIDFDVDPEIIDGRTMVPVRAIFEAVGAKVDWNFKTRTVTGTKDDTVVQMTVGSDKLLINGSTIIMDCVPIEKNNRVLTPARYVVESYGYVVTWDDIGNTVEIMSMDSYQDKINTKPAEEKKEGFWDGLKSWFGSLFGKK